MASDLAVMHKGNVTGAIFLDLLETFDTIDHDLLLGKLSNFGFSNNTVDWFRSYLWFH